MAGVDEVTSCVSCVDSERASAWKKEDEDKVKALIRSTVTLLSLLQKCLLSSTIKHKMLLLIQSHCKVADMRLCAQVGFQHLNRHVREVMIRWIRATVQKLFRDRLNSRTACAGCEIVRTEVF